MITLDQLMNRPGLESLLVDGFISYGDEEFYIRGTPFSTMAIEGYGDSEIHCVSNSICIQSEVGGLKKVWYNLSKPSKVYVKYFEPFLWVANFCKYFVDYLMEFPDVSLEDFRSSFSKWAECIHGSSMEFRDWLRPYNRKGFRSVVTANVGFLWKETSSISYKATTHSIWKESDSLQLEAVYACPLRQSLTLVTPFVHSSFQQMYFADYLVSCDEHLLRHSNHHYGPNTSIERSLDQQLSQDAITNEQLMNSSRRRGLPLDPSRMYKPGHVIRTSFDPTNGLNIQMRRSFAYIIATSNCGNHQILDVLWLYQPHETTLSSMAYPFANELFLSDKCTCLIRKHRKLNNADVYDTITITWAFKGLKNLDVRQYFVRQKYLSTDNSFRTITKGDLRCHCSEKKTSTFDLAKMKYEIGDVVLYEKSQTTGRKLLPSLILDFVFEKKRVLVQKLDKQQRKNLKLSTFRFKLKLSDNKILLKPQSILRKCHVVLNSCLEVECFRPPSPYSFGGIGDYYVIENDQQITERKIQINFDTSAFIETSNGGNLTKTHGSRKLRGLGLFCGGGMFDRSLEMAGCVEIVSAVDISRSAIHTYKANLVDKNKTKLFLGSVDDFFQDALKGGSDIVPALGEIDIIVAGSPCQGFSCAQPNRLSDASKKNASLVASVAAFIDLYRPKYALLENVISIARSMNTLHEQNVLSQLLCTIVGLGYQAQIFNMDAWAFGCPQKRSRLFVMVTAAGLTVPKEPSPTHACPKRVQYRKVGRASNGELFGTCRVEAAMFDSVDAESAIRDLPNIDDSHIQMCIPFPDHRLVREEPEITRSAIAMIPTCPSEMGIVQAIKMGNLGKRQVDYWSTQSSYKQDNKSKSYRRIDSDSLFPTIMATFNPSDAFCGQVLHWDQHRVISIMEARRAQGIPDEEVLVGSPSEQWRIIGNTVPSPIGIALGLAIAEAWSTDMQKAK